MRVITLGKCRRQTMSERRIRSACSCGDSYSRKRARARVCKWKIYVATATATATEHSMGMNELVNLEFLNSFLFLFATLMLPSSCGSFSFSIFIPVPNGSIFVKFMKSGTLQWDKGRYAIAGPCTVHNETTRSRFKCNICASTMFPLFFIFGFPCFPFVQFLRASRRHRVNVCVEHMRLDLYLLITMRRKCVIKEYFSVETIFTSLAGKKKICIFYSATLRGSVHLDYRHNDVVWKFDVLIDSITISKLEIRAGRLGSAEENGIILTRRIRRGSIHYTSHWLSVTCRNTQVLRPIVWINGFRLFKCYHIFVFFFCFRSFFFFVALWKCFVLAECTLHF